MYGWCGRFSFVYFFPGLVGWRLAYKACIFRFVLFFKPIHLAYVGLGDSGDGDYLRKCSFSSPHNGVGNEAEEHVLEYIFLLSNQKKNMRSRFMYVEP